MNIIVVCECSGIVRDALIAKGHNAISCDKDPTERPGPHIQGDALRELDKGWDGMIAHPPCTDIAVSGAKHFAVKRADGRQQRALEFVGALMDASIPRVAIENPVSIISTAFRKPEQIIQPFYFGDPFYKKTCLWLKGLPILAETNRLQEPRRYSPEWIAWNKIHRMAPGANRAKDRSRTFQGIADAIADQWFIE